MEKLHFISGLPRSGSTLLCNVLLQNPRFYATASSGLIDVVRDIRDIWANHDFFRAMPEPHKTETRMSTIKGAVDGYFKNIDRPVIFDKNRGWPTLFELMSNVLEGRKNVKVILCVRDLRDVLASFEKLYRRTMETSSTSQERNAPIEHKTAEGRANFMLRGGQPVGYARNVIVDAVTRGWRNNLLFFDYDDFCGRPKRMLMELYDFINEPWFEHDFENVEQITTEDDSVHGFTDDLHKIKRVVQRQSSQWNIMYDKTVTQTPFWDEVCKNAHFWKGL